MIGRSMWRSSHKLVFMAVPPARGAKGNSLIMSLFAPDLTIDGMPALSVGVTVTAVGATFTAP